MANHSRRFFSLRSASVAWRRLSAKLKLSLLFIAILSLLNTPTFAAQSQTTSNNALPVCAYVASYHPGYPWQDEISETLKKQLNSHCQLKTFFMNSQALKSIEQFQNAAKLAVEFIEDNQPDVVIVSDDNAVRFVLQEHYKNAELPFVFCGVNNSGKRYGLPYKNTTGMIEKSSLENLLSLIFSMQPAKTRTAMLTTQSNSANLNVNAFMKLAQSLGIEYSVFQVSTQEQWQKAYLQIQHDPNIDLLLFANNNPIKDWDEQANQQLIRQNNFKLSLTMQRFMMPYTALGMTKVASEQANWAAQAAIEIINGMQPNQLAVVPNERFQLWVNPKLVKPFRNAKIDSVISQALIFNQNERR